MADSTTNLAAVRAGFIIQGTTFKAWCRGAGIDPSYAHYVVTGRHNGPKALALRTRILQAALRPVA